MTGTLYVVGTPIGNLEDMPRRAVEILRAVDVCYAEDTRRTGRLLARLKANVPLRSLHMHNERARVEELLAALDAGRSAALVSDAGTPTVSDPGCRAVAAAREAGHEVLAVPRSVRRAGGALRVRPSGGPVSLPRIRSPARRRNAPPGSTISARAGTPRSPSRRRDAWSRSSTS